MVPPVLLSQTTWRETAPATPSLHVAQAASQESQDLVSRYLAELAPGDPGGSQEIRPAWACNAASLASRDTTTQLWGESQPPLDKSIAAIAEAISAGRASGDAREAAVSTGSGSVPPTIGATETVVERERPPVATSMEPSPGDMGELFPGCRVRMHSLQKATELNDVEAICKEWMCDKGRWRVQLHSGHVKDLKLDNLEAIEDGSIDDGSENSEDADEVLDDGPMGEQSEGQENADDQKVALDLEATQPAHDDTFVATQNFLVGAETQVWDNNLPSGIDVKRAQSTVVLPSGSLEYELALPSTIDATPSGAAADEVANMPDTMDYCPEDNAQAMLSTEQLPDTMDYDENAATLSMEDLSSGFLLPPEPRQLDVRIDGPSQSGAVASSEPNKSGPQDAPKDNLTDAVVQAPMAEPILGCLGPEPKVEPCTSAERPSLKKESVAIPMHVIETSVAPDVANAVASSSSTVAACASTATPSDMKISARRQGGDNAVATPARKGRVSQPKPVASERKGRKSSSAAAEDKSHLAATGHTLRPQEMGHRVAVVGDGWGSGQGGYEAVVTEADNHTFTVVAVSGENVWKEAHVLREHCIRLADAVPSNQESVPLSKGQPSQKRSRTSG